MTYIQTSENVIRKGTKCALYFSPIKEQMPPDIKTAKYSARLLQVSKESTISVPIYKVNMA